ncbi:MAG: mevalonate kinase [Candidatus Methanospirareceae archaeon]
MKNVRASAPAKVILFGEHFVVYGKRALATAIDRRLTVEVTAREKSGYHITIENIPTFGLELDLEARKGAEQTIRPYKDFSSAAQALSYVTGAIEYLEKRYGIGDEGVNVAITSGIPLSAGLGSSAATCVATVAALTEYFGVRSDLERIRTDAHAVELLVQGAASPTDTAIATHGGYVLVEQGTVQHLQLPALKLLVGCVSSIPLSMDTAKAVDLSLKTKALVAEVRARKELFPSIFEAICNAADELTMEAIRAIEADDTVKLGTLLTINHGLLDAIGVVPRRLSNLVKVAQSLGALGAKVTGAGSSDELGGIGSVVVLPGRNEAKIRAAMELEGALALPVRTGGEGLKIETSD